MHSPNLLLFNPLSLYQRSRRRNDELRGKIARANSNTQFARAAAELTEFRSVTAGLNGMDDETLSDVFRKTVQFTTYESYSPFIAKFFENPWKEDAIVDLLAPGMPDFIAESSSTSGGTGKSFPKYNILSKIRSLNAAPSPTFNPLRYRTTANLWYLWCTQMNADDNDNRPSATVYRACGTVLYRRQELNLDPEKDREKMGTFILDHAAPYAAGFIGIWRSFLLVHALFAIGSRSLETMAMIFINTFVDLMWYIDMEFDMIIDCIARGAIPALEGIEGVRHYLVPNISPDPERAEELRKLGRPSSRPGWCSHVWPNLRSITCVASGSFATSIPVVRSYLGPDAVILPGCYGSTEALIGSPYNQLELNLFKPSSSIIVEFLDFNKGDSISNLAQLWEVEIGRQYEIVLTTEDGLWRYRLGDVVEIVGFDPTDGIPLIQFIERRNVVMRFPDFMLTEKELRAAVASVSQNIANWTATIDERCAPATIGFFVELATDQVSDLPIDAPDRVLDTLAKSNANVVWARTYSMFRKPSIRLVRPGTFSAFRQLKLDEGYDALGQIKIPVVLPKASYVAWFLDRVVNEL